MTDEELMAFIDGELAGAEHARIAAAVAADPELAARVNAQQQLRARLRATFDPVLEEPVPQRLLAAAGAAAPGAAAPGAAAVASLDAARERREERRVERQRPRWSWRELSAVAATLVLGVLIGPYVLRASQPVPFVSDNGRLIAIGSLEEALAKQPSGAVSGDASGTSIGMTFRTSTGEYCRTFAITPGPAGLACREWGSWVVEVLARNPRARKGEDDTYRQAGTRFPEAVRQAVEARIEGDPIDAAQEARLARKGWRASALLKDPAP